MKSLLEQIWIRNFGILPLVTALSSKDYSFSSVLLTSITCGISNFSDALVVQLYWESLSSLLKKSLVAALSRTSHNLIAHNSSL